MTNGTGIIHAYTIDSEGRSERVSDENIAKELENEGLAWVHLDGHNPNTREWLKENINYLDSIILDALLAEETRPRIFEFDTGSLLILRGVNMNKDEEPEDMVSTRVWVDPWRIVSVQLRNLKAIEYICERMEAGNGPKSSGDFITTLVSRMLIGMEPVFAQLEDTLDTIEEEVLENLTIEERHDVILLRQQAIIFRRYIAPQRDVIAHLRNSHQTWLSKIHKRYLQESLDHVIRYIENLDAIRERAQIVKDEIAHYQADSLNKHLFLLSSIAAIFLPLTFLTGLFGVNVGGIPGAGNPYAFTVFASIMGIIFLVVLVIFKRLKWI